MRYIYLHAQSVAPFGKKSIGTSDCCSLCGRKDDTDHLTTHEASPNVQRFDFPSLLPVIFPSREFNQQK